MPITAMAVRSERRITYNVHQDGQTKLAATQPDKTGQAANWNAPSKGLLKVGAADNGLHALFVTIWLPAPLWLAL
jgi:hypothetical protein